MSSNNNEEYACRLMVLLKVKSNPHFVLGNKKKPPAHHYLSPVTKSPATITTFKAHLTRRSATAEKQRVSCACLPRLAN